MQVVFPLCCTRLLLLVAAPQSDVTAASASVSSVRWQQGEQTVAVMGAVFTY